METSKATKGNSGKDTNPTNTSQQQQPSGGSLVSAESISRVLNKIPQGVSTTLDKILASENRLREMDAKLLEINDLLKPISRIDRRRGVRPKVTGGMKQYYKDVLKRLQKERFIEAENWAKLMQEYGQTIRNDVKKTRNEFLLVKARSNRYIAKNVLMVVNKIKGLLEHLYVSDQNKLILLKEEINTKEGDVLAESIKTFLQENDTSKFLSTMYMNLVSSKSLDLQAVVHRIFLQLLNSWNPGISQPFSFKEINVSVTKKRM